MACAQEITLEVIAWDETARQQIGELTKELPGGVAVVERAVRAGRSFLWGVFEGGERCGSVVCRADDLVDGSRDFVVEFARAGASIDLTRHVLPVIEGAAYSCGASRIRIHTERRGLVKKLTDQGYSNPEFVLVKGLRNGV